MVSYLRRKYMPIAEMAEPPVLKSPIPIWLGATVALLAAINTPQKISERDKAILVKDAFILILIRGSEIK